MHGTDWDVVLPHTNALKKRFVPDIVIGQGGMQFYWASQSRTGKQSLWGSYKLTHCQTMLSLHKGDLDQQCSTTDGPVQTRTRPSAMPLQTSGR